MAVKTIAQKLYIKDRMSLLLVNAPPGYPAHLKLPKGIVVAKRAPADCVLAFIPNSKEMQAQLPALKKSLASNGMLWVCYYKGTSKTKTDINRDSINAYAMRIGLQGVAMISIPAASWSRPRARPLR